MRNVVNHPGRTLTEVVEKRVAIIHGEQLGEVSVVPVQKETRCLDLTTRE